MQGGFGNFPDDDSANELGPPPVLVVLPKLVILCNGKGRHAPSNFRYFQDSEESGVGPTQSHFF